jgi:endonuclease/exonuclease/phosphatase family metal-dependent hydrolase
MRGPPRHRQSADDDPARDDPAADEPEADDSESDHDRAVDRRALLRSAGAAATGAAGLAAGAGTAAAEHPADRRRGREAVRWNATLPLRVRVATWNLGLGTPLYGFVDRDSRSVDPRQVYDRFRDVIGSAPATRMRAIGRRIADDLPAVVGLQEAALIRRGPNDYTGGSTPNADRVAVDFLAQLRTGLDEALSRYDFDVGYEVAVVGENADEEFPAEGPDGERFDVRLTDRDVLLVRDDLAVRGTETRNYTLNLSVPLDDGTQVSAARGYALAEVERDGARFTVATTHLEVASATIREAQAAQLAGRLDRVDGPALLLGDLNTTPDGDRSTAYDRLVGSGLTDVWAATTDSDGPTCCQNPDLRNEESRLGIRLDMVLSGGPVVPLSTRRQVTRPDERVTAITESGTERLWPTDHAAVVADVRVEPRTDSVLASLRSLLLDG